MFETVKQKIWWGTLFLFLLLLLLGGVGIFHIVRLKNDSQIILSNNYESLDYSHSMQNALDSVFFDKSRYAQIFETVLQQQEKNITEVGEKALTESIRNDFEQFKRGDTSDENIHRIQASIQSILRINMAAIELKNERAGNTASQAMTYISLIATIIFLVGLTFSFNFPAVVSAPIDALIKGIREIAAKNYHYRIHLDRKDEFGQMAGAFNGMAERLEYFENSNLNQILFEKARAEAVINSLKDASIGVDGNGRVLFANDQALQLIGLKASDIVARPSDEVAKQNDLFRFLMEEKTKAPFTIVVDNRDNYYTKEVIELSQSDANAQVIVLKNITPFKELDAAKTNLIATISHELKTPLASSDFSIKLLEDERTGTLNKEQKEYIGALRRDNERMLKILSELLNIAQIEAGKIELNIKPVSPYTIVENAIGFVESTSKERGIELQTHLESGLPGIMADADKTVWVLTNLLTNAVKYSPDRGLIKIEVRMIDERVEFSVADTGPGIAEEHQPKLFNRFFRVPGAKHVGNGLGLAISKEFIDAQNGSIWVHSKPGEGAVFGFSLKKV